MIRNHPKITPASGLTLIEMAVVVTILGLLLVMLAPAFHVYIQRERLQTTTDTVTLVTRALGEFRTLHGRYPCPAPLDVTRDDPTYGHETDCTDTSTPAGNWGVDGVFIQQSNRTPPLPGGFATTPRVRMGAVPFRTLNIDETAAYDGHLNRLTYAVTEHLARVNQFNPRQGGISLFDDTGANLSTPPHSVHFLVLSHGRNGNGAFTQSGLRTPCGAAATESMNCNDSSFANYRAAPRSLSEGGAYFDDVVQYFTPSQMPLWRIDDPAAGRNVVIPAGQVGVNIPFGAAPTEPLHVEGTLRAIDDPDLPNTQGNVLAGNLCAFDASDDPADPNFGRDCFPSSLIAGSLSSGGGMACPAGQFMVGIQHGSPICEEEIVLSCPPGRVMTGINTDGTLRCNTPPPSGCGTNTVNLCGETRTLASTGHGGTRTITAGDSRVRTYRCNGGSWQIQSSSGVCTCVPETQGPVSGSCGSGVWENPSAALRTRERTCPAGTWTTWVTDTSACVCLPKTETADLGCPAGYTGTRIRTRNYVCTTPSTGHWEAETITDNCVCDGSAVDNRTLLCSFSYGNPAWSGTILQTRSRECPANVWSPWETVSESCSCTNTTQTDLRAECGAGYSGVVAYQRSYDCATTSYSSWVTTGDTCAPLPPVTYHWTAPSSGVPDPETRIGPVQAGEVCGTPGATSPCWSKPGSYYMNYETCVCGG